MHFLKDNKKRDSYNKLNSVSGVKSLDKGITFPLWATTALQEKKVKIESINQCSTLMFLDTRHKLLAHKDKPLVREKWRLFKT